MQAIILDATDELIEGVLAGAVATTQPDFTAHYADNDGTTFTEGSNDGTFNSTTDVTIVASPAASTRRTIKNITVYNADTASITFTLKFTNGASERIILKKTLAAAESWDFTEQEAKDLVDDTTPQLGGDLDMNDHSIQLKNPPGSDVIASGLFISVTVDTNAEGVGAPLFLAADGHFDTADADASTTSPAVVLALETGTGTKKVLVHGILRNDAWNWTLGPGKLSLIYVSVTVGTLTQTKPTGEDDVVQPVGWAITADTMYFCPSLIYYTYTV